MGFLGGDVDTIQEGVKLNRKNIMKLTWLSLMYKYASSKNSYNNIYIYIYVMRIDMSNGLNPPIVWSK